MRAIDGLSVNYPQVVVIKVGIIPCEPGILQVIILRE